LNDVMRLDYNGNVTISNGTLIMGTSGEGIDFSANANAAGMTSELLDDYEEGTWTPVFTPTTGAFTSVTYDGLTAGQYTKIGNTVFFTGRIRTDAITVGSASGALYISGFPLTVSGSPGASVAISNAEAWAGEEPIGGNLGAFLSTDIQLKYRSSVDGNAATSQVSDLGTGANDNELYFSGFYYTS